MNYLEMLKMAREKFGLVFKKRPKKEELESLIAEARAKVAIEIDPVALRAKAEELRNQGVTLISEADKKEERAQAIETACDEFHAVMAKLYGVLVEVRDATTSLNNLGIEVSLPIPRKIIRNAIRDLTPSVPPVPPKQIYVFWVEGKHSAARGYVAAESFEAAKLRWAARDIDHCATHPGTCGWPAATEKAIDLLKEGESVNDEQYSSTLFTQTLAATHLYHFGLDGPEYEGKALVSADTFTEAKAKAFTGDILEGDKPEMDEADLAELLTALKELSENGQVVHEGYTLVAKTIL